MASVDKISYINLLKEHLIDTPDTIKTFIISQIQDYEKNIDYLVYFNAQVE